MDYANELQLCYDEMLDSFGQFEVSANEKIKMFEEKLVNAVNYAKVILVKGSNCILISEQKYGYYIVHVLTYVESLS